MPEYGNTDQALAGLQVGVAATRVDGSFVVQDVNGIGFGSPVMSYGGYDNKAWPAHQDQAVDTLSGSLVSGDTFTITINGTLFSVNYATSSDATVTAMVAAINASAVMIAAGISAATTGASNFLTVTIKALGLDLTVSSTRTGSGSATTSIAYSTWASFLGVALFAQRGGRDYGALLSTTGLMPVNQFGGSSGYQFGEAVNIMSIGRIWVPVAATTQNFLDSAYLIFGAGATQNQFTNVASAQANKAITSRLFMSTKNSQGLAILSVNDIVQ